MLFEEKLSQQIIGAAIEVHRHLGPGLLESAYASCLGLEFDLRCLPYKKELNIPVTYKGMVIDCGYRLDFLVDDLIIVELKSVAAILPIHEAQLLTYLRLTQHHIGLLINFNVPLLKDGIKRMVL